ncbi:hypothetical protein HY11_02665 [Hyphomonas pacifica]|nr:hypothetical protein HY11_02665 [Hyphomonas pacifica]
MVNLNYRGNTMLKDLLEKLKPSSKGKGAQSTTIATPDISRVIKMPKPETTTTETPSSPIQDKASQVHDPEEMGALAEAAVDDLSGQFEAWMQMDLNRLKDAWAAAQESDATPEDYRNLYTCAHNIRGVAGSYGYPAISRLCGSLCTLLSDTAPGENSALINLHVEACRAAHTSIGRGESSQSVADAVCDALEQRVARKTSNS